MLTLNFHNSPFKTIKILHLKEIFCNNSSLLCYLSKFSEINITLHFDSILLNYCTSSRPSELFACSELRPHSEVFIWKLCTTDVQTTERLHGICVCRAESLKTEGCLSNTWFWTFFGVVKYIVCHFRIYTNIKIVKCIILVKSTERVTRFGQDS